MRKPADWLPGRGCTQKTGTQRKKKIYSKQGLDNIRAAAKSEDRRKTISLTLIGHDVTNETRKKISKSLKVYNAKIGDDTND